jgi:hypothetical protein
MAEFLPIPYRFFPAICRPGTGKISVQTRPAYLDNAHFDGAQCRRYKSRVIIKWSN